MPAEAYELVNKSSTVENGSARFDLPSDKRELKLYVQIPARTTTKSGSG
jgi:hypothetical protein